MNFNKGFALLISSAAAAALVGCSAKTNKTEVVKEETIKTDTAKVADARGEHVVTTLQFDKGQINLTDAAKTELQNAVSQARAKGDIDDVTIAVWSDMEYPRDNAKVPKSQVKLAEKRGDKIEDYLAKDMDISSYRVQIHNMGEKPNFLSQYFETADADLKQQLSAMGISPSSDAPVANGRASSALVFIKTK